VEPSVYPTALNALRQLWFVQTIGFSIRFMFTSVYFTPLFRDVVSGTPDLDRAGTSHVERNNGTLRQWCKRLTRLTHAFSKQWANLQATLALHFAHYNFCRIHGPLRITPAMAAGITDHVWGVRELLGA
jgi:hypothetical protein